MPDYDLTVNGRRRRVTATADTPLLWIIRDELALTGTKFGCGIAQCGACTVQINGAPTPACVVPVASAANAQITTIEGLASSERGARLQAAWIAEDVPQCGYCQSGMLMAADALLEKHPAPTDPQINDALNTHICRCGTYVRIRKAIKRAARGTA